MFGRKQCKWNAISASGSHSVGMAQVAPLTFLAKGHGYSSLACHIADW